MLPNTALNWIIYRIYSVCAGHVLLCFKLYFSSACGAAVITIMILFFHNSYGAEHLAALYYGDFGAIFLAPVSGNLYYCDFGFFLFASAPRPIT